MYYGMGLGMYDSELVGTMREALRFYFADPRGEYYTPGRAYAATNYENQIIQAYFPKAKGIYGGLSSIGAGTVASGTGFKNMVDTFAVTYLKQQAASGAGAGQPAPSAEFFGRPLTPNEKYALAGAGGLLTLGLLLLLTKRR